MVRYNSFIIIYLKEKVQYCSFVLYLSFASVPNISLSIIPQEFRAQLLVAKCQVRELLGRAEMETHLPNHTKPRDQASGVRL